ncbi:peptidoglycan-binding membrane protein, partial [Streptomyces sp. Tu 6176]|uniref:peptidoglycan-binding domain-containing protein n=1 Tax=Streptomyces sp. Tu 6176 TaxID=1470557 RepID=UPI0004538417
SGAHGAPRADAAEGADAAPGLDGAHGSDSTHGAHGSDATMSLRAITPPALSTPLARRAGAPSASDLSLFDARSTQTFEAVDPSAGADGTGDGPGGSRRRRRRRRPAAVIAVSTAVVAVVAATAYAGGLFSYESPARDGAAQDVREGIPDGPAPTVPSAAPTSAAPVRSPSPSVSATTSSSPTASTSASASPSATGHSPTPSGSPTGAAVPGPGTASPTQSPPSTLATASTQPAGSLRRGDHGPAVRDLQERLTRLYLYTDALDGYYSRSVEDSVRNYQWARGITSDGFGVYGPATRASLEAEPTQW